MKIRESSECYRVEVDVSVDIIVYVLREEDVGVVTGLELNNGTIGTGSHSFAENRDDARVSEVETRVAFRFVERRQLESEVREGKNKRLKTEFGGPFKMNRLSRRRPSHSEVKENVRSNRTGLWNQTGITNS